MRQLSLVAAIGLAMLSPVRISGQAAGRPSIDTVPLALLPTATVVRREVPHTCFDCWSSFATDISLDGVTVQVRKVDDLPAVWRLLTPLPDSGAPEALRFRLLDLFKTTFLPDASPGLVASRSDLNPSVLPLIGSVVIQTPRDVVRPGYRSTSFVVSTQHGLHRIDASVNRSNVLTVSDSQLVCYLCP